MLESHINSIENILLAQSKVAQNAGHPNLRGGPREWFIREFLEGHLPSSLEVGQGEVVDENSEPNPPKDRYRPQVDIVIYRRDLPKIMYSRDNMAFLAEGVIATIESKSNLTKAELKKACKASCTHKELVRTPPLHQFGNSQQDILSYIVAFDSSTKSIGTMAAWMPKIQNELENVSKDNLIDMIIVLGKGVIWNIDKLSLNKPSNVPNGHYWAYVSQKEGNLFFLFTHFLTWMDTLSSPPNLNNYVATASAITFNEFSTI
ncbi:DUF6602 domain-containing protein [Candidatus Albibeggiatoa sp. nov. BB20]|uniref:DUF6602 domain-containing protein n=1 Tax=Candidatus Albibeggiatoa sp. nov. BB20 TaxID=3162723 RepID=UPI003365AE02